MLSQRIQKIVVVGVLAALTAAFFYHRVRIYEQSDVRSIDEYVFYNLGLQITEDIKNYNTIPYGEFLVAGGRRLPQYFFAPLFKHPPVFAALISGALRIFGKDGSTVGGYAPAAMGALLIPLTFLLARFFLSPALSLLAALFVFLDPVVVMCSQKIWMGTTIAFFTLLATYFFVKALKEQKDVFFVLSGMAAGLLVNTKYSGFLFTLSALMFLLIYRRAFFQKSGIRLFFVLPFVMLVPWFAWNFQVYGPASILEHKEIKLLLGIIKSNFIYLLPLALGVVYFKVRKPKVRPAQPLLSQGHPLSVKSQFLRNAGTVVILIVFFGVLRNNLLHSLSFSYVPTASWGQLFTSSQPGHFYFGRLLEYSFIYLFAFLNLLVYQPDDECAVSFLRINAFLTILFFSAWGAYQSRYIIAAVPLLIVLGLRMWSRLFSLCEQNPRPWIAAAGRYLLLGSLVYALMKTEYINYALSYTNNMCYF